MGVLIDSSVLIGAERGRMDLSAKVAGREAEEFYLSVITASELLHGVWRAKESVVRSKRAAFVEAVLSQFPILAIDLSTARLHAQLWAHLEARGRSIGSHDIWLSATAIAHDLSLATSNVADFQRIPGLRVEAW